jgi:hypothetical protein
MDAGILVDLTFDLEGRRSDRTGRAVSAVFGGGASPVRFSGDFLGDVRDGPRAQPVSFAMSWSVARAAELMALSHVAARISSPWWCGAHARWTAS